MAKLFILVTLVTMIFLADGFKVPNKATNKLRQLLNRRDPFPEPKIPPPHTGNVVAGTVIQRVDNFNPANNATWEQRYLMNGQHFLEDGCIFLFLSGEWSITEYRLENSFMEELSQELSCYMFYLEHRYYGESRPTADITDENLRFLTVEQALADAAHFIEHIRSVSVTPGAQNSPVIVIGGHYSASLAAWMRQQYPHLVAGAWASSAPVFAVYDHSEYKELSGAVYRHLGGSTCYNHIENGFAQMERMVADGQHTQLETLFYLCNQLDTDLNRQIFFSIISEIFSLVAQFDQITNVRGVCNLLDSPDHESDVHGIRAVVLYLFEELGYDGGCIDIDYLAAIAAERHTNWEDAANYGLRPWSYQLCTQFGWYHSSTSRFQPYGSSFGPEFRHIACADIFDFYTRENAVQNINRFNSIRGGRNPGVTNVIYTHGQLDPTRTAGVQTTYHETSPVIVIEGASQGNDLGPSSEDDSEALTEARETIKYAIYRMIREAQRDTIVPI